jgi:hypothetical protein
MTTTHVNPDTDLTVVADPLATCGCVTYWRTSGAIPVSDLHRAWTDAGLDQTLLRAEPEPATALRRAVDTLVSRSKVGEDKEIRTLVRPGKERHEWAVVEEIVEIGAAPRYTTLVIVSYTEDEGPAFKCVGADAESCELIRKAVLAAYDAQKGVYDPGDITGWLVKLAYANGAVTLRDSGGVYFIPRDAMAFWSKAADVVEQVSNHRVFRIPAMRNTEAVAAIVDAVSAEAATLVAAIEADMSTELGARALKTRQAQAEALLEKVTSYEKLLGLQIEIRERVTELSASVAAAVLTQ